MIIYIGFADEGMLKNMCVRVAGTRFLSDELEFVGGASGFLDTCRVSSMKYRWADFEVQNVRCLLYYKRTVFSLIRRAVLVSMRKLSNETYKRLKAHSSDPDMWQAGIND